MRYSSLITLVSLPIVILGSMTSCTPAKRVQRYKYLVPEKETYATKDKPGKTTENTSPAPKITPAGKKHKTEPVPEPVVVEENRSTGKVVKTAMSYIGTPYQYGGMSRKGMDCSGLICTSYKAVNKSLPRTSAAMSTSGRSVPIKRVAPGDLVFFSSNNGSRINHVGMVTKVSGRKVEFIHATTSRGVRIDSLDDPYWNKRFRKAVTPS